MRLPVFVGAGAMTTGILLLGGLLATELNPMPVVNVDAMELDGTSVLSAPLPQVSPHPKLVVRVSRPLKPGDWHLVMDGRPVALSATAGAPCCASRFPAPWHSAAATRCSWRQAPCRFAPPSRLCHRSA